LNQDYDFPCTVRSIASHRKLLTQILDSPHKTSKKSTPIIIFYLY